MAPDLNALAPGSSLQRNGLNHQAIEDYLKTIYMLEQDKSPVSTSRIADARQVKPGSVTSMIQRLNRLNLVNYEKHYGVTLTDAGREIALEVIRHHRLVELYLIEALGFGWDEVHKEADILEHVISEQLEERIAAALNNPKFDPHGDPIPSKEGQIASMNYKHLTALDPGARAVVSRIPDDADSELLRYLGDLGLIPGTKLMVLDVAPFDGPLTIEIDGESKIIGHKVASSVLVELKSEFGRSK